MEKIGINPALLGFQLINFAIIVLLLDQLVFKPLSKIIEERKKKIQAGLAREGEADVKLADIEVEKKKQLDLTKKEIDQMMAQASKQANEMKAEVIASAKVEADVLVTRTKERMLTERAEMMADAKDEVAALTVKAIENVFSGKEADALKKMFNQRSIDKLWQSKKK